MESELAQLQHDTSFQVASARNPWLRAWQLTYAMDELSVLLECFEDIPRRHELISHACTLLLHFLCTTHIEREELSPHARCCLSISTKLHASIYMPLEDTHLEAKILNAIEWRIHVATPFTLMEYLTHLKLTDLQKDQLDALLYTASRDPAYFCRTDKTTVIVAALLLTNLPHEWVRKTCKKLQIRRKTAATLLPAIETPYQPFRPLSICK